MMRRALLLKATAAALLGLFGLLNPLGAAAQAPGACQLLDHVPPAVLSGHWELTLWPESPRETQAVSRGELLLEPHPDYAGSVRGDLQRSSAGKGLQAVVSGDVTEGSFHLDESQDGERMSAVWSGKAEDCAGRIQLTGLRRPAENADSGDGGPALRFRLQRTPRW